MIERALPMLAAALLALLVAPKAVADPAPRLVQAALGPGAGRVELSVPPGTPYRAFVIDGPPRLVIDLKAAVPADVPPAMRAGALTPGWSRLIAPLPEAQVIRRAELSGSRLRLRLARAGADAFARAAALAPGRAVLGRLAAPPAPGPGAPPRIVIDPGHGGIDPGAVQGGLAEKDLMLAFAHALAAELSAAGRWDVALTRTGDRFLALDDRVAFARDAGAVLFLSLHANSEATGTARGATVYVPGDVASDPASAARAVAENRVDGRAGLPAGAAADDVTRTLLDLARAPTRARAEMAAQRIVAGLEASVGVIGGRPLRRADFRVLRAPDVPSVLVELGFMTHPQDRRDMASAEWRGRAARALARAIDAWARDDADFLALMRQ